MWTSVFTRSPVVAKRPRDAARRWKFCKDTQGYATLHRWVGRVWLLIRCNWYSSSNNGVPLKSSFRITNLATLCMICVYVARIHRLRAAFLPRTIIWCLHRCVCVMDSPALWTQRAVYSVKFVKPFATWQHRFDVDSNFLSYSAQLFLVRTVSSKM